MWLNKGEGKIIINVYRALPWSKNGIENYKNGKKVTCYRITIKSLIALSSSEATSSETDTTSAGCASNTYVGQKQSDGSWKTVCKE